MITAATGKNLPRAGIALNFLSACGVLMFNILAPAGSLVAADRPAQGRFLVATPELMGSSFSESVVLLVQHDDFGTMGLIINQPSEIGLSDMLPEIGDLTGFDAKLYIGGPVATYGIMVLIQNMDAPEDAEHVFGNVYASGSRDLLIEILSSTDPSSRVRLYAGHAGWSPGQLDREIVLGSWRVMPASEGMIFSEEPTKIWRQLAPLKRPIVVQVH